MYVFNLDFLDLEERSFPPTILMDPSVVRLLQPRLQYRDVLLYGVHTNALVRSEFAVLVEEYAVDLVEA